MPTYNAEGVVIRVRDLTEADKVLHILSREYGKLRCVAKAARRPKSRFTPAAQLFTHLQIQAFTGRNLDTITQAEIVSSFRLLREDLTRMACATYACELVDEMVQERQPLEQVYLLLLTTLHLLSAPEVPPEPVLRAFELKLLAMLGFRPVLDHCLSCGAPVGGNEVLFSAEAGGVVCRECAHEAGALRVLPRAAVEAMRFLLATDLRRAHVLRYGAEVGAALARALEQYVEYRLDKRLKSLEFLHQVLHGAGS